MTNVYVRVTLCLLLGRTWIKNGIFTPKVQHTSPLAIFSYLLDSRTQSWLCFCHILIHVALIVPRTPLSEKGNCHYCGHAHPSLYTYTCRSITVHYGIVTPSNWHGSRRLPHIDLCGPIVSRLVCYLVEPPAQLATMKITKNDNIPPLKID